MALKVTASVRHAVEGLLKGSFSEFRGGRDAASREAVVLTPDVQQFRAQSEEFARLGLAHRAALFRDGDDSEAVLPILLAPDLMDLRPSYDRLSEMMHRSGIRLQDMQEPEAEQIFVDRASEFLQQRLKGGSGKRRTGAAGSRTTVVDSNRAGDTVLYCKGYFVSTATAFGISTPCSKVIPAGRYSFGITDPSSSQQFEGVLWNCPAKVRLNLP